MNYKQKYNEALNDMRVIYPNLKGDAKLAVEHAFPELAESKDERIVNQLINLVNSTGEVLLIPTNKEELVSWLEKQKEQKPAEYLNKDMIYAIMNKLHDLSFSQLIPIDSDEFEKINEITGDVHKLLDYLIEQKPAEWSEEDGKTMQDLIDLLWIIQGSSNIKPGTASKYEQWLKSLRPHPKQEWSEEDKRKLNRIYEILGYAADDKAFLKSKRIIGDKEAIELQDFLKSLRPKRVNVSDQTLQLLICYLYGCHDVAKRDGEKADCRRYISYLEDLDYTLKNRWKPSEDEERLINTSISFLKDFADKGYENAVECIDWLKSKLNGNSGK